eukprot:CAMPEP_0170609856 /NCGR_PEP_ID=MMETSP0224-20130122/22343_1 /TAXON_ID=285029 /ORGANISM="Togula jolla, Strain CCCM 725" /LENGTH=151 /DNA_ID=CAMNT_0010935181 /DNA_START=29 /DNA_END=484 /DNA_ORIENTATION=-
MTASEAEAKTTSEKEEPTADKVAEDPPAKSEADAVVAEDGAEASPTNPDDPFANDGWRPVTLRETIESFVYSPMTILMLIGMVVNIDWNRPLFCICTMSALCIGIIAGGVGSNMLENSEWRRNLKIKAHQREEADRQKARDEAKAKAKKKE